MRALHVAEGEFLDVRKEEGPIAEVESLPPCARTGYKPFQCTKIQEIGGCLGSECPIYRRRKE